MAKPCGMVRPLFESEKSGGLNPKITHSQRPGHSQRLYFEDSRWAIQVNKCCTPTAVSSFHKVTNYTSLAAGVV